MSHDNSNSVPVSGTLKSISILLAMLMLAVSCYHAGGFLWRTSGEGWVRYAMVATVFALLAASHCLSHLIGHAVKRGMVFVALLCTLTLVPIELFSIATSAASLDSRVITSVRRENHSSPEYLAAMRTVNNYQAQIESLRLSANKLPDNYVSKRESLHNKISVLQTRQDRAQDKANNINVSTTGAVYASLEAATSLSASDVSRVASVMLSVAPLSLGFALATVSGVRRKSKTGAAAVIRNELERAEPVKKLKRHLQAV